MTVEEPPTTTEVESPPVAETKTVIVQEGDKAISASEKLEEQTDTSPTDQGNEEKSGSGKKRNLFNNPFAKGASKKEEAQENDEVNAEDTNKSTGENKITKGLGNIYSKIKVKSNHYFTYATIKLFFFFSKPQARTISRTPRELRHLQMFL
jgi:hypothetical protein